MIALIEFPISSLLVNTIKFSDRDVETLTNSVHAILVGIPFPFIGVDETEACDQIYNADGETKHGCPLKAGEEYVYKNQFEVLELYPRVSSK